ncbi:hypothetical protein LXL04_008473 [Taraxacum kok-saghyz]
MRLTATRCDSFGFAWKRAHILVANMMLGRLSVRLWWEERKRMAVQDNAKQFGCRGGRIGSCEIHTLIFQALDKSKLSQDNFHLDIKDANHPTNPCSIPPRRDNNNILSNSVSHKGASLLWTRIEPDTIPPETSGREKLECAYNQLNWTSLAKESKRVVNLADNLPTLDGQGDDFLHLTDPRTLKEKEEYI